LTGRKTLAKLKSLRANQQLRPKEPVSCRVLCVFVVGGRRAVSTRRDQHRVRQEHMVRWDEDRIYFQPVAKKSGRAQTVVCSHPITLLQEA